MTALTNDQVQLLREPNFAAVTTLKADGTPQTSIVWIDEEDGRPVFNTKPGRAKGKHLRRDPRVNVTVWDRNDPYHYVEVEGIAEQGANDHINKLSQKYRGTDFHTPSDRVIVRVTPTRVLEYID
jgi:PPOX class probable F420-dependent enzyme